MEHLDVAMAKYYEMTCGQCGMKSEPIFNSELADRWLKMHYEKRHREALPGPERRLMSSKRPRPSLRSRSFRCA